VSFAALARSRCSAHLFLLLPRSYSSVPVYLPTFINELGYTSIRSQVRVRRGLLNHSPLTLSSPQGLSAPPYLVAWIMALAIVYVSDRLMVRGVFVCGMFCVGASVSVPLPAPLAHPRPQASPAT
jgi:hypothetical protein